ncbi:MAG: hypothetical protein RLZZ177_2783 [Pseudomonadota bacterium]
MAAMSQEVKAAIAATAARLVVEEGLEYGPAKRRALRELGLPSRSPLPANDMLEDEVFDYLKLFCSDTQPQELRALRELALTWMERLQVFRPHLSGAVWRGSATRLSDIYIQLFCDDAKSAELMLIDQGVRYEVQAIKGFKGEEVDALSIHSLCTALNEDIGVHLMVYDYDDLRGALQPDERGLAVRGDLASLRQLLDNA